MKKATCLFYFIFAVLPCLVGQNFLEKKMPNDLYIIDTLVIKNANVIVFVKSELRLSVYKETYDSVHFYYLRVAKAFITNDSCLKEIQLKKLKSTDIYPNYGIYTIPIFYYNIIVNHKYSIPNFDIEYAYQEDYIPDTVYIEKFEEDETEFYLCLVKESFFYITYGNRQKIPEDKPFLALIPNKWVENKQ